MQIAIFTHHHRSERPDWKIRVATPTSHVEALVRAVEEEFGYELSEDEARTAIAKARTDGEAVVRTEEGPLVVWWLDGGENFGCGEGASVDDTIKSQNVWIKLVDWQPKEGQQERYLAMEKEELVGLLLERDALA